LCGRTRSLWWGRAERSTQTASRPRRGWLSLDKVVAGWTTGTDPATHIGAIQLWRFVGTGSNVDQPNPVDIQRATQVAR
jgi:hypothetical protein